jgi:O-antigen biosynthesis protein
VRLAFVVPRYGPDVVGGAETLVRDYAERLAAAGHTMEVLTTCARDHFTWRNELPAGTTVIQGVRVHRHPVTRPRDFHAVTMLHARLDAGFTLDPDSEREWVMNTGYSEPLLQAIADRAGSVDALIFAPYLFASTCFGARIRPEKSVIIPCLHDEPYARFSVLQQPMRDCATLVFNSAAERDLAQGLLGSLPRSAVVGAGFDEPVGVDPQGARRRHHLEGPLVAYAGRREIAKNFPLVVECVAAYDRALHQQSPVTLAAMGSGKIILPPSARGLVADIGYVPHQDKLDIIAASSAVVQLSLMESFSYAVMEGWLCGVPAIVHADCAVTRSHCEESGGGLWIRSPEEFSEALDRIRADDLGRRLGDAGRRYVAARYSWPAVLDRLLAALQPVAQ